MWCPWQWFCMLISCTEVQYLFLHILGKSFLQISTQISANLTEDFRGFLSKSWKRHLQVVIFSMPRPFPLPSIKTQDSHIKHGLTLYAEETEHIAICSSVQSRCFVYRAICHFISVSFEAHEQANFYMGIEYNDKHFVPRYYYGINATY